MCTHIQWEQRVILRVPESFECSFLSSDRKEINLNFGSQLLNILCLLFYISGRLLKAFQIDFNWYHLASWVNITEQWPFRTSWIILYYDMYEDTFDDSTSLKTLYDK
jgi:ankyrin repeat-rich membrane spanning protein